jgi:hypothetical protein
MEKRMAAEEVARQCRECVPFAEMKDYNETVLSLAEAEALVRADRKATLEAAAERYREVACPLINNPRARDPGNCTECNLLLGPGHCTEVAAILRDEED